jgi:PAS domain S-box-containing protein
MKDQKKTKEQLVTEVGELRQRLAELGGSEAERRRIDEDLAKSKAILTAAIECLPFDFYALDADGRCILQNAASRRLFGNALGKTAEQVCPDRQALSRWLEGSRRALGGEQVRRETEIEVAGEHRHFYSLLAPIQNDGTLYGTLGVNVDITASKRAEEALRESEARYRALAESTRDVIYILDREGTLLYANRAASQCIGIPSGEIVGRRQEDLFPPELALAHVQKIERAFATGEVLEQDEMFHFGPEEVWLRTHLLPLHNEAGQVTSVMGVCHNITEWKRAEEGLKQARDELERRVEERTIELRVSNERLQQEVEVRRRAEDSLRESELRLRQAMRIGNSYAFEWNPITDQAIRSPECADILRLVDEDVLHDSGERFFQRIVAEDGNRLPDAVRSLTPSADTYTTTYRLARGDGSIAVLEETARGFFDASGHLIRLLGVVADITKRKQAEAALLRSEESLRRNERRFRNYFEQGLIGMAVTSLDARWLEVNERLCEILGYPRAELLQKTWKDLTHPEDLASDMVQFNRLRAGEIEHYTIDKRFVRRDGKYVYATIHVRALRKDDGSIDHIVGLMEDITARKLAEQSLRQSHDELRAIYDHLVDGIIVVDGETTNPIRANAAFCRMLGYSQEEVSSITPEHVHPPEALPMVREHLAAVKKGDSARIADLPFRCRDGTVVYADVVSGPINYNGRPGWISFFHDVTERKQAEEALRASEERFRGYFEQGLLGMAVTSLDKEWVEVNERLCEILGYSREELTQMRWPEATYPDDLEASEGQFNRMLAGEMDQYTLDKRFLRKDGKLVYVTLLVRCFRRKDGTPDHILALMEDVTERKQAQEALERERRTLEHLFRSSDHERQLIAYDIHDGLAQFLAGAIMQFDTFSHITDVESDEAEKAFDAGMRMLRRSHAEARRLISGVRPPILDEEGIVAAISHLIHEHRQPRGPKIEFQAAVGFSRLESIEENAIYRIVQEALANACKYSRSDHVLVRLAQQGDRIRIEVEDWGIGFDQGRIGNDSFGLEGIRERVRLLGGQCSIESAPGEGTRVAVELPFVASESCL